MPDITMCNGNGCPKANKCYRLTAKPSQHRQSYFVIAPVDEDGECEYFGYDRDREVEE
jgi:hypothetical protein